MKTLLLVPKMRVCGADEDGLFCPRCGHNVPSETAKQHILANDCEPLEVSFTKLLASLPKVQCPCGCGEMMDPISAEDVRDMGHYWRKP